MAEENSSRKRPSQDAVQQPPAKKMRPYPELQVELAEALRGEVRIPHKKASKGRLSHQEFPVVAGLWKDDPRLDYTNMSSNQLARVELVTRKSVGKLLETFKNNRKDRFFLTGPRGCGKSCAALEAVCVRQWESRARAVHVKLSKARGCWEVLLQAVYQGFWDDKIIIAKCNACVNEGNTIVIESIKDLYKSLPGHCDTWNKIGLFLVVDSVDDMTEDLEKFFRDMLEMPSWREYASVLFLGTRINKKDGLFGERVYMDPVMEEDTVREVFKMENVNLIKDNKKTKQTKDNLDVIRKVTGFVPGELVKFLEVYKLEAPKHEAETKKKAPDVAKIVAAAAIAFKKERKPQLEAEVEELFNTASELEKLGILRAILWMKAGAMSNRGMGYILYGPLMYESSSLKKKKLMAISELAHEVLCEKLHSSFKYEEYLEFVSETFGDVFRHSSEYDAGVVAFAIKETLLSAVAAHGELIVKPRFLRPEMHLEKPSDLKWEFTPSEVTISDDKVAGYEYDEGNKNEKLLFSSSNLDTAAFVVEDDGRPTFGVTGIEVCLNLSKPDYKFYDHQASAWRDAASLDASKVRLLWVVHDTEDVTFEAKVWKRRPKSWEDKVEKLQKDGRTKKEVTKEVEAQHYFVTISDIRKANPRLAPYFPFEDDEEAEEEAAEAEAETDAEADADEPPARK